MRVRRKWSGQLVPRLHSSRGPRRVCKRQRIVRLIPVRDRCAGSTTPRREATAGSGGGRLAIDGRCHRRPAKCRAIRAARVLLDELAHLIDGLEAVQVAGLLRVAPREQAVAAEQDAVAPGLASTARRSISASSKPGRCHGIQTMCRPYRCVELLAAFCAPFALAARAIAQSGCR